MAKIDRVLLHGKYGGRCAYCGKEITLKQMQADHIEPIFRGWEDHSLQHYNVTRGTDAIENMNPACARCNLWKGTWTVEQFRNEISQQVNRLLATSSNFRMANDYGSVLITENPITFYFETLSNN